MKKLIQTRLSTSDKKEGRGNCFPAVIACFMDLDSPEDVIQIQEYYGEDIECGNWVDVLLNWFSEKGIEWGTLDGHQYDGSYYLVIGETIRKTVHVCIYRNGEMYHDPHPSGVGLCNILEYEYLIPI